MWSPPDGDPERMPLLPATGVVLAGGQSARFGSDKAVARLGGRTLASRNLKFCSRIFTRTLLVGPDRGRGLSPVGVERVPDLVAGQGPLMGLYTALIAARTPWVFLLSCDAAFPDDRVLALLISAWKTAQRPDGPLAVVPEAGGRRQVLFAWYHRDILGLLGTSLRTGQRSVRDVLDGFPHQIVVLDGRLPSTVLKRAFFNINTPVDLAQARRMLSTGSRS